MTVLIARVTRRGFAGLVYVAALGVGIAGQQTPATYTAEQAEMGRDVGTRRTARAAISPI